MCKTQTFLSSANPGLQEEGQEPRTKGEAGERSVHGSGKELRRCPTPASCQLEPTNLSCANGHCRLNVIEACRLATVIVLNIQNEDCFISEKAQICQAGFTNDYCVSLHKGGVWTGKEIQLLDPLPPYFSHFTAS